MVACRACPILALVIAFVSVDLGGELPATTKDDPSYEDFVKLPPVAIYELAIWLTAKVKFLGLDPLSSMPDKVIFCRALWHTARGRCQIQTFR